MGLYSRVKEIFSITGRGHLVALEMPEPEARIKTGDRIKLRTPDGRVLERQVRGIVHMKPIKPRRDVFNWGLSLSPDVSIEEVPPGTEIWVANEE